MPIKPINRFLPFFLVMLLFFGMIGQNVMLFMMDKLSEDNTTGMSAVVSSVSCTETADGISWAIQIKEPYGELWITPSVGNRLDASTMEALQPGQTVSFRMDPAAVQQFREMGSGYIVALQADQEIFSIDEYNEIMRQDTRPAKIVCMILQAGLLLLLLYLARKNGIFQSPINPERRIT